MSGVTVLDFKDRGWVLGKGEPGRKAGEEGMDQAKGPLKRVETPQYLRKNVGSLLQPGSFNPSFLSLLFSFPSIFFSSHPTL